MAPSPDYDRIARPYRFLEWLAFGSTLQKVRTAFLRDLLPRRSILILGEGDGRQDPALVAAQGRLALFKFHRKPRPGISASHRQGLCLLGPIPLLPPDNRHPREVYPQSVPVLQALRLVPKAAKVMEKRLDSK